MLKVVLKCTYHDKVEEGEFDDEPGGNSNHDASAGSHKSRNSLEDDDNDGNASRAQPDLTT